MVAGIPLARLFEKSSSTSVPRDGDLRDIVEQVLHEQLDGSIGRKGRNALATSTLNTFPKFELAVILMYLMTLPNVCALR